ncbi:glycogen debranching protein [Agromyces seonyuensis]|uniref:Glycogen debranching enzyme n=1 Tax=Agromyces seonyuensis TaxID=2662446 RepID=A0A6I4NW35_9MICO|nr:isoamylase [Agromyces seonyuensis]MWB98646.1 glycogen debranching enzyme [Agromyces seonyuensis]
MIPADSVRSLGVRTTSTGPRLAVWSQHASAMTLVLTDPAEPTRILREVPMRRNLKDIWAVSEDGLVPGAHYALRVDGPRGPGHDFDPTRLLLDPYAKGLVETVDGWRGVVVDGGFDWGGVGKPRVHLDRTVISEVHVKGFSALNPEVPAELRGTYAGLAHESSIRHFQRLGVTTVELLPVQQSTTELWLAKTGKPNYWGYNTLGFFAPHGAYATQAAQAAGADAVLAEFKGMVRLLHEAGLEVVLDVVYNHTAEEGADGPTYSFRGIDNLGYYRHDAHGNYVDTTGCGNSVDFGSTMPVRLVLDSMRYWAEELQIDGFRLDLAAALGRDDHERYTPDHPLLVGMLADPILGDAKLIAEPWDIGPDGWQTGNFPHGFSEWNDRYRDRMRDIWLGDLRRERKTGDPGSGIGRFATRLAGSSNTFSGTRGPLASVNFISAHDGFTMADLTAYDVKHNQANGEHNRDGSNNNNSYNHGVEGPTDDVAIIAARRQSHRNLLGTLLLSAGIPMLGMGDESARSTGGNNNPYCLDDESNWLHWDLEPWQDDLVAITAELLRHRAENPALRPMRFGRFGETTPGASRMDWYNAEGGTMTIDDWNSPRERTLQYLAASTPEFEEFNRILLVVHAHEAEQEVVLPAHSGVTGYTALWSSADERPASGTSALLPGDLVTMAPVSMRLFRAEGVEDDEAPTAPAPTEPTAGD